MIDKYAVLSSLRTWAYQQIKIILLHFPRLLLSCYYQEFKCLRVEEKCFAQTSSQAVAALLHPSEPTWVCSFFSRPISLIDCKFMWKKKNIFQYHWRAHRIRRTVMDSSITLFHQWNHIVGHNIFLNPEAFTGSNKEVIRGSTIFVFCFQYKLTSAHQKNCNYCNFCCNIWWKLLRVKKENILATDLQHHLKSLPQIQVQWKSHWVYKPRFQVQGKQANKSKKFKWKCLFTPAYTLYKICCIWGKKM